MTEKKNAKKYFISGAIVFLLFAILTLLVKTVDVKAVGPNGSEIGLSGINTYFRDLIGVNMTLYDATEILGYIPIAVAAFFACVGAYQLIKGKSIKAVDSNIIILGVLLAVLACAYIFFEIMIVNYRPIVMDGKLEASFPSSHTMLSVTVLVAVLIHLNSRTKNTAVRVIGTSAGVILILATVIGRLLSGVHWFTDIVAGLLLSISLLLVYIGFCKVFSSKNQQSDL